MTNEIAVSLSKQIQEDYLSYSLSVIIGRAIPRLSDGCKPIARRILTAMKMLNLKPDGRFMKSARVEGEVMGKYSPHGSSYGSIVTLAAPWNNLIPVVNGHGNWGSSTNSAAASRYTEAKLSEFAWDCLLDDSNTWETTENYDGTLQEPVELNVKVPFVLLNGQEGIGVGYACRIPSHGLKSIIEAIRLVCSSSDCATEKAYQDKIQKARLALIPDFPTGTQIVQDDQLDAYMKTGAGGIRCIAKVESGIQKRAGKTRNRSTLSFTCLPPGTNPEKLGEQIKGELEKGRIEGIAEIIDESDMSGDRLTVVLKPGVDSSAVKQLLYTYTDLDCKFSARTLVIDGSKPIEIPPVEIIKKWVNWRLDRLEVKFEKELDTKEKRLHIVLGLLKTIDRMDLVIKRIRAAENKAEAMQSLMATPLKFTEPQAEAILEMRLRQLTGLDFNSMVVEKNFLQVEIDKLETLIGGEEGDIKARRLYMLEELSRIGKQYGKPRRSPVIEPPSILSSARSHKGMSDGSTPSKPVSKIRFLKVDLKKGTVEQTKKLKGSLAISSDSKLVLMTEDGTLKKVPATFKGTISTSYSPVVLAKESEEVSKRKYLVVFKLEGTLRAMTLSGEDLCKTTSSGKRWLPNGAELTHFGEKAFTVTQKKKGNPIIINLTTRQGKPGAKGTKIANLTDITLNDDIIQKTG